MKGKILLIEDSEGIQESFSSLLKYRDYDVIVANNGFDGMKRLAENHVDVIILDILMPIMSGLDFLENIKHNAKYSNIPVLVITGMDEADAKEKALKLGAREFFCKPVQPRKLLDTIDQLTS